MNLSLKPKTRKQSGLVSAEYAIMIGLVVLSFSFGIAIFGQDIINAFDTVTATFANEGRLFQGQFCIFVQQLQLVFGVLSNTEAEANADNCS